MYGQAIEKTVGAEEWGLRYGNLPTSMFDNLPTRKWRHFWPVVPAETGTTVAQHCLSRQASSQLICS